MSGRFDQTGRKQKPEKKKGGCFLRLLLWLFLLSMAIGIFGLIMVGLRYYPTFYEYEKSAEEIVGKSTVNTFRMNESSYIYDSDMQVIAKLRTGGDSAYLSYDEIPEAVVNAFIAVEDNSFWNNKGYDPKGIARVAVDYIMSQGQEKHGASTITQQLARNVFLTQEKSLERKGKEILIARQLTKKYSKKQIMEYYINDIYYANGYYGIEAAAKGYFGKSASELSLSQLTYLCAIPNRPSYYDPFDNPENGIKRRNKILKDMLDLGYIEQAAYDEAVKEEITIVRSEYDPKNYEATYAIHCSVETLMKADGFEFLYHFDSDESYEEYQAAYSEAYDTAKGKLYTGGYKIFTSIDSKKQTVLQKAVDQVLSFDTETEDNGIYAFQGAATVVDNTTGKVVAIVGGRSQDTMGEFTLNRAYQSYRQPGSTIKPLIVYTPALELGYLPNSTLQDIDVSEAKKIRKSDNTSVSEMTGTKMTLRKAVEQSKNGCAYQLFNGIGVKYGISYIEKMHFTKIVPDDYNLSASLGGLTYGTTTTEMAEAYSTLANYGTYRQATCINSMVDSDGVEYYSEDEERVYEEEASRQMLDILAGVMTNGTGKVLKWDSEIQAVGKTGTTNGSKDGWFCGATPYYTISVWCGYDNPRTLDSLYGGSYPGKIWKKAMKKLVKNEKKASFKKPENTAGEQEYLYWMNGNTLLSRGYTVNDYRKDFTTVDQVTYLTKKMKKLDKESETWKEDVEEIYNQAQNMISTIYGTKAINKAQSILDKAYKKVTGHKHK